jgi:hypothetical protein
VNADRRTGREEAAEAILERSLEDKVAAAEIVQGARHPASPVSIRLSAPLLERLDRIAATEHRKRSNLIQHVLWEYVRIHEERNR